MPDAGCRMHKTDYLVDHAFKGRVGGSGIWYPESGIQMSELELPLGNDYLQRPGQHLESRDRWLESHRVAIEVGGQRLFEMKLEPQRL